MTETFDLFIIRHSSIIIHYFDKNFNGLALDDDVALVVIDEKIKGVIKANENNNGYYINNLSKEIIQEIGE